MDAAEKFNVIKNSDVDLLNVSAAYPQHAAAFALFHRWLVFVTVESLRFRVASFFGRADDDVVLALPWVESMLAAAAARFGEPRRTHIYIGKLEWYAWDVDTFRPHGWGVTPKGVKIALTNICKGSSTIVAQRKCSGPFPFAKGPLAILSAATARWYATSAAVQARVQAALDQRVRQAAAHEQQHENQPHAQQQQSHASAPAISNESSARPRMGTPPPGLTRRSSRSVRHKLFDDIFVGHALCMGPRAGSASHEAADATRANTLHAAAHRSAGRRKRRPTAGGDAAGGGGATRVSAVVDRPDARTGTDASSDVATGSDAEETVRGGLRRVHLLSFRLGGWPWGAFEDSYGSRNRWNERGSIPSRLCARPHPSAPTSANATQTLPPPSMNRSTRPGTRPNIWLDAARCFCQHEAAGARNASAAGKTRAPTSVPRAARPAAVPDALPDVLPATSNAPRGPDPRSTPPLVHKVKDLAALEPVGQRVRNSRFEWRIDERSCGRLVSPGKLRTAGCGQEWTHCELRSACRQ